MKSIITSAIASFLFIQSSLAGGSITWEDVKTKISKSDPDLVKLIEQSFTVESAGGGVRLGPQFVERQGERVAPYEFGAEDKKSKEKCLLVIEENEDFELTGRFKLSKKSKNTKSEAQVEAESAPREAEEVKVYHDDLLRRRYEGIGYEEFSLVQIYWALPGEFFEGSFEDRINDLIRGRVQFAHDKNEIYFPGDGGQMSLKIKVVTQSEDKLIIHVTGTSEGESFWKLERILGGWKVLEEK